MVLIIGILAIVVAIILWIAKVATEVVFSFGGIGAFVLIIGLILLTRGRRSAV
ncbi:hypothetical protein [Cohnella nanjingensis]|uniref:Uncharacterized protein n=1 Tax=Cohnella nanjingensis TaxID=1387779 RepID=A0A7X0RWH5_9BACL|nr:hypothetical protein [Cohnella nanjingensis]MBB6674969.1 hypothetical protein [Cohnella nanjingensis]